MRICLQDPCSVTLDCRGSCIITQTSWQPRKKGLQKRPSFSSRPRASLPGCLCQLGMGRLRSQGHYHSLCQIRHFKARTHAGLCRKC